MHNYRKGAQGLSV